jgi:hypothetical protein
MDFSCFSYNAISCFSYNVISCGETRDHIVGETRDRIVGETRDRIVGETRDHIVGETRDCIVGETRDRISCFSYNVISCFSYNVILLWEIYSHKTNQQNYIFIFIFNFFYLIIDLADEKFYIINIQTLCKTDNGDRLPCEIGAIEYSLRGGITKTLHRFIEPGKTVIS